MFETRETVRQVQRDRCAAKSSLHYLANEHAGYVLVKVYPDDWPEHLPVRGNIDWSQENSDLREGRARVWERMSEARANVLLSANVLKQGLGLPATQKE